MESPTACAQRFEPDSTANPFRTRRRQKPNGAMRQTRRICVIGIPRSRNPPVRQDEEPTIERPRLPRRSLRSIQKQWAMLQSSVQANHI